MTTERLPDSKEGIARAADLLRAGAIVAFPTETVYGLGADARNSDAVAAIYAAKARPAFNPLIVHVATPEQAMEIATFNDTAAKIAAAHWPGPLSMILPLAPQHGLSPLVTAGLSTVALRVPAHPLARDLLAAAGLPVAAPSANPSGRISPTRPGHVLEALTGKIAALLDGGACSVGLESTIIDPGPPPRILRAGGVATEALVATLGEEISAAAPPSGSAVTSPGQLASHYAPRATLRLNADAPRAGEFFIGFGAIGGDVSLSAEGDVVEAAKQLFDLLHTADATGRPIAVAPIPETGLGRAINDRLRRAAAPR